MVVPYSVGDRITVEYTDTVLSTAEQSLTSMTSPSL